MQVTSTRLFSHQSTDNFAPHPACQSKTPTRWIQAFVWIHPCGLLSYSAAQSFCDPIRNPCTGVRGVVQAAVVDAALTWGKYLQLAIRAVSELVEGLVRVLQRDLPVRLAMGH